MSEERVTIMISGVGGQSVGHQILHAVQLLGDKYRTVCTDAEVFSFGLYSADARYVVPRACEPGYLDAVQEIIQRQGVRALLPGTEPEIQALVQHRSALAELGCRLIASPLEVVDRCQNKWDMDVWLRDNGFSTPRTVEGASWKTLVDEVGFPVVAKPCSQTGGSRGVALLQDVAEVERYLSAAEDQVILQEYVASPEDEYTVGVLIDKEGRVIDSIAMRRNLVGLSLGATRRVQGRAYALSTGYSQGYIASDDMVQRRCEELARALGARGPLNVQCRRDGDDIKVFEVHPRFSGTTSIRAEVGFNEPDVLIQNELYGTRFERLEYRRNVAAIRALQHIIVPLSDLDATERLPSNG